MIVHVIVIPSLCLSVMLTCTVRKWMKQMMTFPLARRYRRTFVFIIHLKAAVAHPPHDVGAPTLTNLF